MITYRNYAADITANSLGVQINDCGLLEFKDVDYRIVRPSWQEDYQLLYIVEGVGHFRFDGHHTAVSAGGAVLYAPGDTQEYGYAKQEGAVVWFCHFKGSGIDALLAECPIPSCTPLVPESRKEICERFSAMTPNHTDACTAAGAALSLMSILQSISHCAAESERAEDDPIAPALADIRENYMCDRSIEEYAALCHLSKYHFLRRFKLRTGVTPVVYRNEYRLNVAEQLLAHSNLTVEAAAITVGFSSAAYFCRIYKRSRGRTCRQK